MVFLASARRSHSLDGAFECNSLYRMTECCLPYVTGIADRPSPECCNTVQRLKNMANKREEVVQYCQCFQAKALRLQHLNESTLRTLPNDCGYSFHSQAETAKPATAPKIVPVPRPLPTAPVTSSLCRWFHWIPDLSTFPTSYNTSKSELCRGSSSPWKLPLSIDKLRPQNLRLPPEQFLFRILCHQVLPPIHSLVGSTSYLKILRFQRVIGRVKRSGGQRVTAPQTVPYFWQVAGDPAILAVVSLVAAKPVANPPWHLR
ncbi:hypothetical protein EJ110_NYTH31652 [Nymphaea thermarum]|nr:hypothetical protein EJ110_NYTH31652 [Nymphaea thermarum]